MLFLCQVSFQLQFSPRSSGARPRMSYYVSLPRTHWGLYRQAAVRARRAGDKVPPPPSGSTLIPDSPGDGGQQPRVSAGSGVGS